MKNIDVSIIIVNYKVEDYVLKCIRSIWESRPKSICEIIVVDNDEIKTLGKSLRKKFPEVKHISAKKNNGFGAGNNLGAKAAQGKYLFFLNPDTLVKSGTIDNLLTFAIQHKEAGIVAPLLYHPDGKLFNLQGSLELDPLRAIFSLSLISKLWKNNPIFQKYYLLDWNKKKSKEVDVAPGTAFLIKKDVFEKVHGFDEHFFLYFEENDLCKRIKDFGYKVYMIKDTGVIHSVGQSTKKSAFDTLQIFINSRNYYFKKHYGFLVGTLTNWILQLSKSDLIFLFIFLIGIFLRFYQLSQNFYYDGEIGDNLLDIKNAFVNHTIPLIGPPTSHPWLYFGPLFYWIYMPIWILFKASPLSYGYFGAVGASLVLLVNYVVFSKIFNKRVGLFSTYFITISPIFLGLSKSARFFSLVPIFVPIFLLLVTKLQQGKKYIFFSGIILGIMLNFHYTPLVLIPFILSVMFIKKLLFSIKYIVSFLFGVSIPMLPFLFYDFFHRFTMTTNLSLWIPYRILGFLGLYHKNTISRVVLKEDTISYQQFFSASFLPSIFNVGLLIIPVIVILIVLKMIYKRERNKLSENILFILLWGGWGMLAIFVHGSPPLHYFVPFMAFPIIMVSLLFNFIWEKNFVGKCIVFILLLLSSIINFQYLFSDQWFYNYRINPYSYKNQVLTARKIVSDAKGNPYELKRVGFNDQFAKNYAQNYIYLLWYFGNEPKEKATIQYIIYNGRSVIPQHISENETLLPVSTDIVIIRKNL